MHLRARFQLKDAPTRILRSATLFIPRLSYYLPRLIELRTVDDPDLESSHLLLPLTGNAAPAPLQLT